MWFGIALKALVVWVTILILAILNGGLREAILIPKLGTVAGNIMSGVFLSVLILTVAYLSLPFLSVDRPVELIAIGLGWDELKPSKIVTWVGIYLIDAISSTIKNLTQLN